MGQPADDMAARHGRMLAELSELSLSLARNFHQRAAEAEDPKTAGDLGLAFQRVSRSMRQTLALEAKLERDRRREACEDRLAQSREPRAPVVRDERRIRQRVADLRAAVRPLIWQEAEREDFDDEGATT